ATLRDHPLVLLAEAELVHLLFEEELSVAHIFDLHPTHHLANNHLDVLIRDVHTLKPVDFLDFVHQVRLQLLFAQHGKNVVRVEWAVHERFARLHALSLLHIDVNAAGHRIFLLGTVISHDVDLALSLRDLSELDRAIDFADDSSLARLAGLEQLDHTRQTSGDVFRLGGLSRDLGQDVTRIYGIP